MLSPIPRRILRDTLTLYVPTGFDRYQKPLSPVTYTVHNVHMQNDNITRKGAADTTVTLKGVIFVDARYSTPALDYEALQEATHALGGVMTCQVTSRRGDTSGQLTVAVIDALPDDEDNLHHWELGVI